MHPDSDKHPQKKIQGGLSLWGQNMSNHSLGRERVLCGGCCPSAPLPGRLCRAPLQGSEMRECTRKSRGQKTAGWQTRVLQPGFTSPWLGKVGKVTRHFGAACSKSKRVCRDLPHLGCQSRQHALGEAGGTCIRGSFGVPGGRGTALGRAGLNNSTFYLGAQPESNVAD